MINDNKTPRQQKQSLTASFKYLCYFHPLPAGGTLFPRWLQTGPFSSSDHRPVAAGELVLHRIPSPAARLTHHSYNRLSLPNRQLEGGATERAKSNKYIIAARLFSYAAHGFKLWGNFHLNRVLLRLATALRSTCSKRKCPELTNASSGERARRLVTGVETERVIHGGLG